MHVTHADLRAYVDGELPSAGRVAADQHLEDCPDCRVRLKAVAAQAARVSAHLAPLAPRPAEAARPAGAVLAQLKDRQRKERLPMFRSLLSKRPLWASLTAVLALAVAFSFAPVRAWAGEMLGLFRVERIQVLPVDTTQLSALTNDSTLADQISQMFADTVNVSKKPGKPVEVASVAEASQAAGFDVRTLSAAGDARLLVSDGAAFEVTINRARAQALLDESGRGDLKLPDSIDGATISVAIPTGVTSAYGNCPEQSDGDIGFERGEGGPANFRTCVIFAQIPSPSVSTPPNVDLSQLAELGLQFTGMSAADARQFSQSIDWTTTLVLPIPRNAASYSQVSVDGVTGTLIERSSDDGVPQRYMLMWVKGGIVYALSGFGSQADALALAGSIN